MRLVGFSFSLRGAPNVGPLRRGYLPFDDLTAILGPNDSGKSKLIELIDQVLTGPGTGVFFAACSPEEFSALTAHGISDLLDYPDQYAREPELKPTSGQRESWWRGPPWATARIDPVKLEEVKIRREQDPVEAWREALLSCAGEQHDAWRTVLRAATSAVNGNNVGNTGDADRTGGPLLALEPTEVPRPKSSDRTEWDEGFRRALEGMFPEEGGRFLAEGDPELVRGWNLYWCVREFDSAPSDLQDALQQCGIRPSEAEPDDLWDARSADDEASLENHRLRHAPILIAPLGRTALPIAPFPLHLPLGLEDARNRVEEAVKALTSAIRWAERLLSEPPTYHWGFDVLPGTDPIVWAPISSDAVLSTLDNRTGVWDLHPDAMNALAMVAAAVEGLLPGFLKERYTLESYWHEGQDREGDSEAWKSPEIHLDLAARSKGGEEDEEQEGLGLPRFRLGDAAEGYKVWLQLALLTAVEIADQITVEIRDLTDAFEKAGTDFFSWDVDDEGAGLDEEEQEGDVAGERGEGWDDEEESDPEEWEEATSEFADRLRRALEEFRAGGIDLSAAFRRTEDLRLIPAGRVSQRTATLVTLVRPRLYLIDEPEQHLHPRLQRQAAEWLSRIAQSPGSQVAIATHSVAFLGIASGATYTYLTRAGVAPTLLRPIRPLDLNRLDAAADDLGFNRGELLALVKVFLWVEGPMDKVVFESLFPAELRNNGIAISVLGGHSRASALLDSPLLSYTEAKVAVWLDNIPGAFLARLREDPEFAREAAIREKDERKTLAKLVSQANEEEKEVQPVGADSGHAADVFDLLDDEVTKELYPEYPGHAKARATWEEAMEGKWKKGQRKVFWEHKFKTPITVDSCRQIANRMQEQGSKPPPALSDVIKACERLALEVR